MPSRKELPGGRIPDVDLLPEWMQAHIERDKVSPRCGLCHGSMPQAMVDLGHTNHICCAPRAKPTSAELDLGRLMLADLQAVAA
jgi:hypothetical protein